MSDTYFVIGLGYGDEGKGTIVDFLTRETNSKTIVRYNGGPQAAHCVVRKGITHCFSQFGSGTFVPGTRTCLSKYVLVNPLSLENEQKALEKKGVKDAYQRLNIDLECLVVTPMHKILGQMQELSRGKNRNGSCGMGVGEAVSDSKIWGKMALRISDLLDEEALYYKLDFLWRVKLDQSEQIADQNPFNKEIQEKHSLIKQENSIEYLVKEYCNFIENNNINLEKDSHKKIQKPAIYEGAQGVLLDVNYGFWPHVTKTNTTFENANKLANGNNIKKIGVIRSYSTRHGAGPFVSEDEILSEMIPDINNKTNKWQGEFRIGWLDIPAINYALEVIGGVDTIAVTNLDRIAGLNGIKACVAYEYAGKDNIDDFFDYEIQSNKKIIHKIKVQKNPTRYRQHLLGKHLDKCKPVYLNFEACKKYLNFLESEEGLSTPISIISFGPEAEDKITSGHF